MRAGRRVSALLAAPLCHHRIPLVRMAWRGGTPGTKQLVPDPLGRRRLRNTLVTLSKLEASSMGDRPKIEWGEKVASGYQRVAEGFKEQEEGAAGGRGLRRGGFGGGWAVSTWV